jgi:spermidine synthase
LAARLATRGLSTRQVTPGYIRYLFTTDRFEEARQALEGATGIRLNRDLWPVCYYYDLALWLSRFYPGLRGAFEAAGLANLWWAVAPLGVAVALARWRRKWAVPLVVAGVGLAGMSLQVALLFAFQALHGYVYAEISLLVTAFMAGLALGGAAGVRIVAPGSRSGTAEGAGSHGRRGPRLQPPWNPKQALQGVLAIMALYSGALPLVFSSPLPALAFPILALLAGCLGGMAFPLAVAIQSSSAAATSQPEMTAVASRGGRNPQFAVSDSQWLKYRAAPSTVVGSLYAADVAGGCLAALLGAAFLVPVLGIPQTCAIAALAAAAGLLALV